MLLYASLIRTNPLHFNRKLPLLHGSDQDEQHEMFGSIRELMMLPYESAAVAVSPPAA
jgi:hypothetical protein